MQSLNLSREPVVKPGPSQIDPPAGLDRHVLSKNTLWMLLAFGYRMCVQAAFFVIIARTLGRSQFGVFAGAVALVAFLSPFSSLGTGNLLIAHVTRDRGAFAERWGIALRTTVVSGLCLTGFAAVASALLFRGVVSLPLILMVCAADLVSARLLDVAGQAFQSFGRLSFTAAFQAILATLRLAGAVVAMKLHLLTSAEEWAICYMLSSIAAAAVGVTVVGAKLGRPRHSLPFAERKEGVYFAVSLAAQNAYSDIDKTMLVSLSTLGAAGTYAAAYRLIDAVFAPVRALVYAAYSSFFEHGADGLERSSKHAIRLMGPACLYAALASLGLFLAAPVVPRLLGAQFADASPALRWLALLPLIKAMHYFGQDALTGANHQGVRTVGQFGVAAFNVGINLWLIPAYGWRGAAWASIASECLLAVVIWTSIAHLRCRRPGESGDVEGTTDAFSLVVGTLNRPGELRKLVASLSDQGVHRIQLIVLDQSDPGIWKLNEMTLEQAPPHVQVHHVRQEARGLSRARNRGLAMATGSVVAFPDDDCWYPPMLLRRVADWFDTNPNQAILAGVYGEDRMPHPRFPRSQRRLYTANAARRVSSVGLFVRGSAVEGRETLFREDLGAGTDLACGEEVDFVCRLLRRGYRGRSVPSFLVHHAIERATTTGDEALKRVRANAFVAFRNALSSPWLFPRIARSLAIAFARAAFSSGQRQHLKLKIGGYRLALLYSVGARPRGASLDEE